MTEQLEQLSRDERTTLAITTLAAFQVLLHRYTESSEVVVAIPALEPTDDRRMGHLCLASDVDFREFLSTTDELVSGLLRGNAHLTENLILELRPDAGLAHSRPMTILFEASRVPDREIGSDHLQVPTQYDLSLRVTEMEDGLDCSLECDADLIDADATTRMAGHMRTLLEGVVSDRHQSLSSLPILIESERRQLLEDWNQASGPPADGVFRHQIFESLVDHAPDAVAVVSTEKHTDQGLRTLTYRELDNRANQLANYLIDAGVGPEVRVGICMEASAELVIAVLAICKAAGACVPLDPSFPADQLAHMIDDSDVALILSQAHTVGQLPDRDRPVVCLDADWDRVLADSSRRRCPNRLMNENLAIVFYTSGSTGTPKAVMSVHRKLDPNQSADRGFTATDHHLLKTSIGFTPLQLEVFLPLTTGGRIIVAPPEIRTDSRQLLDFIAAHRITVTNFVPTMLRQVLHSEGIERCQCLRHVFCFGEPLPVEVREKFFECLDAKLEVHYGTTEATSSTTSKMTRADHHQPETIGRRNKLRKIYILDGQQQPVPCGITGELYVGGPLARGYLNRPDATADRFVPDPFSDVGGERLYRTGDRACYLPDGSVQFLGRSDDQVKIRGYRVELGEVAAALGQHPQIDSAVVIVRKDEFSGNQLVAYMVCSGQPEPGIDQIRGFLTTRLPAHMIPTWFVFLDSLPLGHNGKVDRRALPDPDTSIRACTADYVAPRTEFEKTLAEIWCDVLGIQRVGIHDSFLAVGGHSLAAMRIAARIAGELGIELQVKIIFESITVAGLAERLCAILLEESHSRQ